MGKDKPSRTELLPDAALRLALGEVWCLRIAAETIMLPGVIRRCITAKAV